MTFQAAFYKGTRPGLQGLYSRAVRLVDGGPYSHCELVFSDGLSASASYIDGGVRFKHIEYDARRWDFIALPPHIEYMARRWFEWHEGDRYDLTGNIRFLAWFVPEDPNGWFCSEAIAAAMGMPEPHRLGPNGLAAVARFTNQHRWAFEHA